MLLGTALLALATPFALDVARPATSAPALVWRSPSPSTLANSVTAIAWSPVDDEIAIGSTDRWLRVRRASDGALIAGALEAPRTNGVRQVLVSNDGARIAVQNQASGTVLRVSRSSDGEPLGEILATIADDGRVSFEADARLRANDGADATAGWRWSELTVIHATGRGRDRSVTTYNLSPDGMLQTAAKRGSVVLQRRDDGTVVSTLPGAAIVAFSPSGDRLATWSRTPRNEIAVWRTTDGSLERRIPSPDALESVVALRFAPDGEMLATSGFVQELDDGGGWTQRGVLRFWSVREGEAIATFDAGTELGVTSPVAFSPDGARFAYGLHDGSVAVAATPR